MWTIAYFRKQSELVDNYLAQLSMRYYTQRIRCVNVCECVCMCVCACAQHVRACTPHLTRPTSTLTTSL